MSGPPLPSTVRIVHALWRTGDVQAAASFALSAMARGDRERESVRAQLDRLRAGDPLDVPPRPPPALDEALLSALIEQSRYHEASILLDAAKLGDTSTGRRVGPILDEALSSFPPEADASFAAVLHLIRAGQAASALRALDEVLRETGDATPEWLERRHGALSSLVRGRWRFGATPVEEVTRETVLRRLRMRDLVGALEAARQASGRDAGARELAAVLERLVDATEQVFAESSADMDDPATMPMEGHPLCEFQIRMGVLSQADRGYRALLRDDPDDDRARSQLADVIALRQALGENPEPMPRRSASVAWLSKSSRRAPGEGWSSGGGAKNPRFEDDPGDDSTNVLAAAQEAELLLKLGKAHQALDMYRILTIRHPRQQAYRKRIAEIEALIAQRGVPTSAEVTLKHDLDDLSRAAVPTNPRVVLPSGANPRFSDDDEEWPTLIDKVPDSLRFLGDVAPELKDEDEDEDEV